MNIKILKFTFKSIFIKNFIWNNISQNRQMVLLVNKVRLVKKDREPVTEDAVNIMLKKNTYAIKLVKWKIKYQFFFGFFGIISAPVIFAAIGAFRSLFVMWPFPFRFDFLDRSKINFLLHYWFRLFSNSFRAYFFSKGWNGALLILHNIHSIWCRCNFG